MQNIKQKANRTTKVGSIIMLISKLSKVGTPRLIQIQYNAQANPILTMQSVTPMT